MKIGNKSMKKELDNLFEFARNRFLITAKSLGLDEKDIREIESLHVFTDIQASEKAFLDSVKKILKRGKLKDYNDMNPYVRDFQVFSSYYINVMPNGEPITRFLYGVDLSKQECRRKQPLNYEAFIELLYNTHKEIENFFIVKEKKSNEKIVELNKKFKKIGATEFIEDENKKRSQDIDSVVHYVLNWYFHLVPFNIYKNSPKKLAAIVLYVLKRFNESITEFTCCNYTNRDLSELGEWKSSNGVVGPGTTAFYDIVYSLPDIQLLFINHQKIPNNWKKRLIKIAPAWVDGFEE